MNTEIVNNEVDISEEIKTSPSSNNSSGKFGDFYVDVEGNLQGHFRH